MKSQALFDKYLKGKHWFNHPTIYAEKFACFLKDHGFNKLLIDVGSGNGRDVAVFCKHGLDVVGIDYSEKEIDLAKTNFPQCNFVVQNAENLDLQNKSVGAFFMINVIHYTNQNKVFKEFARTLKDGGFIFIHFNLEIKDVDNKVDYKQDEKKIIKLVSGFKIVEKNIFERADNLPKVHTHKIMELILEK